MKKYVVALLVLLTLAVGLYVVLQYQQSTVAPESTQESVGREEDPVKQSVRLIAAGDFIAHDSVNENAKEGDGYNYLKLMQDLKPLFDASDIRFCNSPILTAGSTFPVDGYPRFNAPAEFPRDIGKLGCNLINTASNHSWDFNQNYIDASVDSWSDVSNVTAVVGQNKSKAEQDAVTVLDFSGIKVAFLAYTTYSNNPAQNAYGANIYTQEFASQQIDQAKQLGAEFVIVSMRWGDEYSQDVNSRQKSEAAFLAKQGVDVILGHGPHVLQQYEAMSAEEGRETHVWYSLGNFLNTQLEAEALFNGVAVLEINKETKKVTAVEFVPIYQHYEWTVSEASSQDLLSRRNVRLMPLSMATQALLEQQQLNTTLEEQAARMQSILGSKVVFKNITDY